jgi:glucose-1-phosphate thymidylyltransferase
MKGILLAGGNGSRLFPLTKIISKQLLPIYDKPLIYYPLSVLMLAGIKEILIITKPEDQYNFQKLLNDGSQFGIRISYASQKNPEGIAQAFIIGENFIGKDNVCLILGDNIFYGQGLTSLLKQAVLQKMGATIFGYEVKNPSEFGVLEFDKQNNIISIEEKPKKPKSNFAATGLYFYDNDVIEISKNIKPSARGELEITSINQVYLQNKNLSAVKLGRGFAWLDTGTFESLLDAAKFVETIEKRQGNKIACLEEIAFNKGWISDKVIIDLASSQIKKEHADYLISLLKKKFNS